MQQWVPTGRSKPGYVDDSPTTAVVEAAVAADDGRAASAAVEAAVAVDKGGAAPAVVETVVAVDGVGAAPAVVVAAVAADDGGAASAVVEAAVAADGVGAASEVVEAAVAADGLGAASADREAAVEPDDGGGGILLQADESCRPALDLRTMPNPSDGSGDPSAVAAVGGEGADATDLQRVQDRVALPCPLDEADGTDDDGTMSVSTYQPGDSVYTKSDGSNVVSDEDDEGAAVAAHGAQPTETHRLTRSTREPRKIAPKDAKLQWKWAQRNDADHVGNIGWLFGNFGSRAENPKMREHIDELLKKQPAMVIGLAEC